MPFFDPKWLPKVGEIWSLPNGNHFFITKIDSVDDAVESYPLSSPDSRCWRRREYFIEIFQRVR